MPKIVFIEPRAPNLHIFSQFPLPRLGTLLLGTMMKERGWDVEVFVEELREIRFEAVREADLVGVSTITSTAPRAYRLADKIRSLGRPVIMGGPHVTFLADEALDHADFVIRGEGEIPLMAFIDAWEGDWDFRRVPNLSFHAASGNIHNPRRPMLPELDALPFPDLSLLKPDRKIKLGRKTIPILTSRGCPFDCSFCSVTGMFGKKFRFRSTESIIRELRNYNSRRNIIFFYDDNFTANRERTKALMEAMIRENFKFLWTTQVRTDISRDIELVKLMKRAGCHTLYIGFESVNPRSLEAMKKKQTVDEIREAAKVLRRHKIRIHGMFIFGFDDDDWQTIKATVKFAKKARLTSTQFLILTPLPGSEWYEKISAENRITFRDWALYDAHHVVFQPARFTLFDLQRAQIFGHRKFYSLVELAKRFVRGWWLDCAIAVYARKLNRMWNKKNKTFLKAVDLLRPRPGAKITVDYREDSAL
ncbi:MAG: B12-binding domain-containing radical SAM protein [Candidatus Aminicenantes bacterium]|nr:B12-binding domain-containing radical SAM protein [Candidatus Aminicenantes bacterium]